MADLGSTVKRYGRDFAAERFLLALLGILTLSLVGLAVLLVTGRSSVSNEVGAALAGAAVAGLASLGAGVLGYVERRRASAETERWRHEEYAQRSQERLEANVYRALDHFAGKTQVRSIGIAVVEGSWTQVPEMHPVLVPMLANQVIYLLSESGQDDAAHEVDNLRRLVDLLVVAARESNVPTKTAKASYAGVRSALQGAIDRATSTASRRLADPAAPQEESKGLDVDVATLKKWKRALRATV
jgi:hypothetical protein